MPDLLKFEEALRQMGCNFETTPTLLGFSLVLKTDTKDIHFEFNSDGRFFKKNIHIV